MVCGIFILLFVLARTGDFGDNLFTRHQSDDTWPVTMLFCSPHWENDKSSNSTSFMFVSSWIGNERQTGLACIRPISSRWSDLYCRCKMYATWLIPNHRFFVLHYSSIWSLLPPHRSALKYTGLSAILIALYFILSTCSILI